MLVFSLVGVESVAVFVGSYQNLPTTSKPSARTCTGLTCSTRCSLSHKDTPLLLFHLKTRSLLRTTRPAKLKSSTIKRNAYLESASYASRILNEQIVWKRPEPLSEPGASPFLTICSVSSP